MDVASALSTYKNHKSILLDPKTPIDCVKYVLCYIFVRYSV